MPLFAFVKCPLTLFVVTRPVCPVRDCDFVELPQTAAGILQQLLLRGGRSYLFLSRAGAPGRALKSLTFHMCHGLNFNLNTSVVMK